MKPVGDNQASASLLVVGHGLNLAFFCFALHLTAAGCRIYAEYLWALPDFGQLVLRVDEFLRASWQPLALGTGLGLWLDWRLIRFFLARSGMRWARIWAYAVYVLVLLTTALCVVWFHRFTVWLFTPIGSG